MVTKFPSDLFPEIESQPMRHILHEETAKLNGTTIRLLRCRNESTPKEAKGDPRATINISRTKNELVASFYDEKRSKYRDFIRMTVADTLPEAMPEFLRMSIKELKRELPKFKNPELPEVDCRTVYSYAGFAEALQAKGK